MARNRRRSHVGRFDVCLLSRQCFFISALVCLLMRRVLFEFSDYDDFRVVQGFLSVVAEEHKHA